MESPMPPLRKLLAAPGHPVAVWSAFARQGAWKSWVMAMLLLLLSLQALALIHLAKREPDVVLVEPDGKSTYVQRSLAGEALARFLSEQRQAPSDITIQRFTSEFLRSFVAVNSATVEEEWKRALGMMAPSLRARMEKEEQAQRLVEGYRAAGVETKVQLQSLELVERTEGAIHVRATLLRRRQSSHKPVEGQEVEDRLVANLIAKVVPRSPASPDGLEVAEYRHEVVAEGL
jgi:glycine/D-amino acid oxidase-like deaminating enzyme